MSKFCVKPFIIAHISVITYQIVFRSGSCNFQSTFFYNSFLSSWVRPLGVARSQYFRTQHFHFFKSLL